MIYQKPNPKQFYDVSKTKNNIYNQKPQIAIYKQLQNTIYFLNIYNK